MGCRLFCEGGDTMTTKLASTAVLALMSAGFFLGGATGHGLGSFVCYVLAWWCGGWALEEARGI